MSQFAIGTAAYNGIHLEMLDAVAAGKFKGMEKLITRKMAIEDLVEKVIMAMVRILFFFPLKFLPSNSSEFGRA